MEVMPFIGGNSSISSQIWRAFDIDDTFTTFQYDPLNCRFVNLNKCWRKYPHSKP